MVPGKPQGGGFGGMGMAPGKGKLILD